jgi:hypothetical protein
MFLIKTTVQFALAIILPFFRKEKSTIFISANTYETHSRIPHPSLFVKRFGTINLERMGRTYGFRAHKNLPRRREVPK